MKEMTEAEAREILAKYDLPYYTQEDFRENEKILREKAERNVIPFDQYFGGLDVTTLITLILEFKACIREGQGARQGLYWGQAPSVLLPIALEKLEEKNSKHKWYRPWEERG